MLTGREGFVGSTTESDMNRASLMNPAKEPKRVRNTPPRLDWKRHWAGAAPAEQPISGIFPIEFANGGCD
jgi:hypothetical protein